MSLTYQNKIKYVKNFAKLADEYSKHNNYSNIIKKLEKMDDINVYFTEDKLAIAIIDCVMETEGILNNVNKINKKPNNQVTLTVDEYNYFSKMIEMDELHNLLKAMKSDHPLVNFFCLIAISTLPANCHNDYRYFDNSLNKKAFISVETIIPLESLDIYAAKNIEARYDFQTFIEKYPFLKNDILGNVDLLKECNFEKYHQLAIEKTTKKLNNFLHYMLEYRNEIANGMPSNKKAFLDNVLSKYSFEDLRSYLTIKNVEYSFGYGYEGMETKGSNAIVGILDYNDFAKKNL